MKLIIRSHFRLLALILAIGLASSTAMAQQYLGFTSSNYSGVHGTLLQPASIVDNRMVFDLNLVSFHATFTNNYVSLRVKDLRKNFNENADFQDTYLRADVGNITTNKYVYLNMDVLGPSFSFNIGRKNAIAFTTRVRNIVNLDNVTPELARLSWEGLDYPDLWKLNLNNERLSVQYMSWAEYGLTYGREIFQINRHYLKAAVTVKLLQGLGAAYLYVDDLSYNFTDDDTLTLFNSDVKYGHSTNFDFNTDEIKYKFISDPTVGFDLGFVYEFRKNEEDYTYDMDGKTGLYRKDKNKYKLKVGFSILDIGQVRYQKGDISANFVADINDYYIGDFSVGSVEDFNDTLEKNFSFTETTGEYFKMKLPTSMSLQVDYNIWKGFYANFTAFGSFRRKNQESKLRQQSTFSIAPRFEHKWFDFAVPFIINTDKQYMLGSSIRLGVLFLGTNNILAFAQNDVYGADFYMGLKVPIPYGKPKDRDKDKVSNRKDKCPKTPGLWEFAGCPDTDLDGLPDDQDQCPNEFGPKDNKGCPYADPDGDGIAGAADDCPDIAGPVENKGCPWGDFDGDGLTDNIDECPKEAGPRENKGCPWGDRDKDGVLDNVDRCPEEAGSKDNGGCPWGDADGDGVLDNVDKCPKTPGPADNAGCPRLEAADAEIIKRAFDNLEFETGKAIIKKSSFASLTDLAQFLIEHPTYKLVIAGHTDDVGGDEMNMKLSKARAEAVAKAMTERGVKEEQLIIEYYGETQPIATNATPEGRAQNRRVEMTIKFD